MNATYRINVSILEKYRDEAYAEPRDTGGMKWHEFDLFEHNLFDGAIKDEKKRQHIKSCLNKLELAAQEIPEHIGNILYLAEPYTFISGGMSPQDIYFMKHVHNDLMNLYKLLKLAENENELLNKFELSIKYIPKNEHHLNFRSETPNLLKVSVSKVYEVYYQELFDYYYGVYPDVGDFLYRNPKPKPEQVLEVAERYRIRIRKNAPEASLRDHKLKLLLEYLNNETDLNPNRKSMPNKIAFIIYWALLLFNIIEKQKAGTENGYIVSLNNNVNLKQNS